jgi:ASC-1-like (ASCH) protein
VELGIRTKYFDLIRCGEKVYEVRLLDEKRKGVEVGDIITFKDEGASGESFDTVVKDIIYFKSFGEMADTLPSEKIGFRGESREEILKTYYSFYTKEDEARYGVVAFRVKVIK